MLETKIFEKKAIFPPKKTFWPRFASNIEYEKRHGTIYKGPQCILTVTGQVLRSFFQDLRGRLKKFLKKSIFSR